MSIVDGMRLAVKRAGVKPSPKKCPTCKGRVVLEMMGCFKPKFRYAIGCPDRDCEWVYAPSVKAAIILWNETHSKAGPEQTTFA